MEIPSDILDAAAKFPSVLGLKVRTGPTFLEYKMSLRLYMYYSFFLGFFLISIGLFLLLLGQIWSILVGSLVFVTAFIPLIFVVKFTNSNQFTFVIDLATNLLYTNDNDISFEDIRSIVFLDNYLNPTANLRGIAIHYKTSSVETKNTLIMRIWSDDIDAMKQLGQYFSQILSRFVHREIPFNSEPLKETTGEKSWGIKKNGGLIFL